MTLRRALALLLLVAALIVAWLWRNSREVEPALAADPSAKAAETSSSPEERGFRFDTAASAVPSSTGRAPVALPPLGTPPAQVVDALLPAARAGDARAQCRLGVELGACQMVMNHLEGLRRAIRRSESAADTRGDESFALRLAEFELALTERRAACSTLDLDGLAKERDWLLEAARRGHTESALRYLDGQSLGYASALRSARIEPWSVIRHPGWAAWQRDAPRIADALLDSGQADVLFVLTSAYANDNTPLGGLYPNDPVLHAAHQIALQRSEPGRAPGRDFAEGLPPGDAIAARKEADALLARLRGGTASTQRMRQRLMPTVTALLPRNTGPDAPAPCE